MMRKTMPYILAVLSGIAVFLAQACSAVLAQAAEVAPPEAWTAPDVDTLLARGLLAAVFVSSTMLFIRSAARKWLAPEPGTEMSRLLNLGLVLVLGVVAGSLHIGPQVTPGVAGWLLGGVVSGAIAAFGRDAVVAGWRVGKGGES